MNLELNGENYRSKRDAYSKVIRETRATAGNLKTIEKFIGNLIEGISIIALTQRNTKKPQSFTDNTLTFKIVQTIL